jgi:hypothetical protein
MRFAMSQRELLFERLARRLALFLILAIASAFARQNAQDERTGVIYGVVVGQDGQPAPNLRVTALPRGVILAMILPSTMTDSTGRYRFKKLQLGRYAVYAHDEEAGYPDMSMSFYSGNAPLPEVKLTADHPEAEFRVSLPPKAGFLQINPTNRKTGAPIRSVQFKLVPSNHPERLLSGGSIAPKLLLLPAGEDVQVHLTSDGFSTWDQTLHVRSGERTTLDLQLDPLRDSNK